MKFVFCITTFNRLEYLKKCIVTWDETRDKKHIWGLCVADDGSVDGTQEYLKSLNIKDVDIQLFFNNRRGVHHQVNGILKSRFNTDFDLSFAADDDIYFVNSNWDNLYYQAIRLSGFDFLCYFNKKWAENNGRGHHCREIPLYNSEKKIQSLVCAYNSFGCFWTFTNKLIEEIGYIDCINFGVFGNGHTDYALRCGRAGFNRNDACFDLFESEKYISMQDKGYKSAYSGCCENGEYVGNIGVPNLQHKGKTLEDSTRRYITYNESSFNMLGEKIK